MKKHFYSSEARQIGITNRSASGVVPDIGSYESALERDFMELSRFDNMIKQIIPQPLTISFFNHQGYESKYTPDGLIYYSEDLNISPILYEIKYRADFRNSWQIQLPKFRMAKKIALSRGWKFKVFTEKEIRTPYLDNIKFLWPYKVRNIEPSMIESVLSVMSDLQEADPALLSASLFSSPKNQALIIPVIWHLVANFRIGCDLSFPLTMHSTIWTKEDI
ncbi:TnsA endonuclease N-terminal domain-containing protein [Vibrio algivorus]|uniref:Heteromeric transposase endonuclease subunit TnsA n=2 Tax=Vibrio algivorus TaxID=1667024 RepID=A0A557NSE4_9VIBR|nr:TnsA endonuclease N-terminal domain-containing protein [Vibrio algivorus]TVO31349.1 heteromeric transposase endonuclease subunit TnsA [Vibrio algivorus]